MEHKADTVADITTAGGVIPEREHNAGGSASPTTTANQQRRRRSSSVGSQDSAGSAQSHHRQAAQSALLRLSESLKAPDAHHESLHAPVWAGDGSGEEKKVHSFVPRTDKKEARDGDTWWMRRRSSEQQQQGEGGGATAEEEGEEDESLVARLKERKQQQQQQQQSMKAAAATEEEATNADGGSSPSTPPSTPAQVPGPQAAAAAATAAATMASAAAALQEQDQQPQQPQGEEMKEEEAARPRAASGSARGRPVARYTVEVTAWGRQAGPPGAAGAVCGGLFSCAPMAAAGHGDPANSVSSSTFMTYKVALTPHGAVSSSSSSSSQQQPQPQPHVAIKRYSELRTFHELWCAKGIVPSQARRRFPGKVPMPTVPLGSSASVRAARLQAYFEALLDEGGEAVASSPLFWSLFGGGGGAGVGRSLVL